MAFVDAQSLQLVWFVSDTGARSADFLYERLAGKQPDSLQTNRQISPSNPFLSVATGEGDRGNFRATVQPGRFDFFVLAPTPAGEFALIGDTAAKVAVLFGRTKQVSPMLADTVRLAFVCRYATTATTAEAANAAVNEMLGGIAPMPGASELTFQVNRRMASKASPGRQFNRLLRWTAETVQEVAFTVDASKQGSPQLVREFFLTTYQIDINLVPEQKPIDPNLQEAFLHEMQLEADRLRRTPSPKALES